MEEYAFLGSRGSGRKDKYSFVVDVLPKTSGKKFLFINEKSKIRYSNSSDELFDG